MIHFPVQYQRGHLDAVLLLLALGAAADQADMQGWTALHQARTQQLPSASLPLPQSLPPILVAEPISVFTDQAGMQGWAALRQASVESSPPASQPQAMRCLLPLCRCFSCTFLWH